MSLSVMLHGGVVVLSGRIVLRPGALDRSRRFCRGLLGLAVCREFGPRDDPGLVVFPGQGLLEVCGHTAGPPGHSVMIWLRVRGVHCGHARLAAAGVPIVRESVAGPWGLIEMQFEDPGGIRIVPVEVLAGHLLRRDLRPALPPGRRTACRMTTRRDAPVQRPPGMPQTRRSRRFAEQITGRRARFQRVGEAGADGEVITVLRVAEAEIGADLSRQLQTLLQECFPGYPGRSYFKLPPHFRYLAMTGSGGVAGQMGVEFRVIRVGDAVVRTFGVVDLCVSQSQRSRGLAGRLLAEVTALARSCGMAFIVLFADDDRLYARNGWARVTNRCSWVRIDEHVTLGLARHADTGAMMVKVLGEHAWPDGEVDLLGHLF